MYRYLILFLVQKKLTQRCKAVIFQLKRKLKKKHVMAITLLIKYFTLTFFFTGSELMVNLACILVHVPLHISSLTLNRLLCFLG